MKQVIQINLSVEELTELIQQIVVKALCENIPKNTNTKIELITRKQTAEILKVSLVTLHNWTKQGLIIAHRVGTRVRYKEAEVLSSLKELHYTKGRKGVVMA